MADPTLAGLRFLRLPVPHTQQPDLLTWRYVPVLDPATAATCSRAELDLLTDLAAQLNARPVPPCPTTAPKVTPPTTPPPRI